MAKQHQPYRLHWGNTLMLSAMHLACLAAPFTFTWSGLAWSAGLFWLGSGIGITLGWHRMLTHGSFKTHRPVRLLLTVIGCINLQHGPVQWVGTHRLHHKHTDHDADPHSPKHGFMWSHMRWTFLRPFTDPHPRDAARDLLRDPAIRLIDRTYWLYPLLLAAALTLGGYLLGGATLAASWLVWGVALRTVLVFHGIWFVNSAAHRWGYRNFPDTDDDARNNWWVALIAFGEGWHNNHHADQRCAAHGRRWWEFDPTWLTIRLMRRLGLAWHVVEPESLPAATPAGTVTSARSPTA